MFEEDFYFRLHVPLKHSNNIINIMPISIPIVTYFFVFPSLSTVHSVDSMLLFVLVSSSTLLFIMSLELNT